MQDVLVHIGYHKTASTWLQKHVFHDDSEIFVPITTVDGDNLAKKFIFGENGYLLPPFDSNGHVIEQSLRDFVSRKRECSQNKVFVMSSERLSGNPHASGFDSKKISEMIKEVFPAAKILIIIREQKSFILSIYFQYLSIGGRLSLTRYCSALDDGRRPYFSPHHINYLSLIKHYNALFGDDNVLVLPYEMFAKEPLRFVDRISAFLNRKIEVSAGSFSRPENKKSHQFVMYYLRQLLSLRIKSSVNDYFGFSGRVSSVFYRSVLHGVGFFVPSYFEKLLKRQLSDYISDWVGSRFKEDIRQLSKVIQIDLADYGY
jgi:hypothetical protein